MNIINIVGKMKNKRMRCEYYPVRYLSESGPFFTMMNLSLASPPRGMRSEPVTNASSCFFCASGNERTICQKLLWRRERETMIARRINFTKKHNLLMEGSSEYLILTIQLHR